MAGATLAEERSRRPWLLLAPSALLYAAFLLVPLALLVVASVTPAEGPGRLQAATGEYYAAFATDGITLTILLHTLRLASLVTLSCLVLGYPLALFMRRAGPKTRLAIMLVVVSPLLSSVIVRNVAWLLVLGREGIINTGLQALGLIDAPLPLLYNTFGVVVGVTHVYLSFLVLPLFASLTTINPAAEESAAILGASPLRTFLYVTLSLSPPGAVAGATLVFVLTMGVYLTPVIMGESFVTTLPMVITDLVRNQFEWSRASAFAIVLLLVVGGVMAASGWAERRLTT
ncbi:hypothetical protein VQ03_14480 [Methylobacterium tarhaniae]|uniref:ABC transmembrane type-1 domain-containing protein n=1 Tax=Methylobacterium tarhaniae TaxID=1187852 RepID=A0A0J6VM37_9HYPH|nr:ABC transporter permease [Methylobacterium tarhaniae]KMO40236.1 hypothetical protein VQ03_14480 [Methylobacterium tarhaniae]